MKQIEAIDVRRLNHEVARFLVAADIRFEAMPIIVLQFADRRRFYDVVSMMVRAFVPSAQGGAKWTRRVGDSVVEFDVGGVTLRLEIRDTVDHRAGAIG